MQQQYASWVEFEASDSLSPQLGQHCQQLARAFQAILHPSCIEVYIDGAELAGVDLTPLRRKFVSSVRTSRGLESESGEPVWVSWSRGNPALKDIGELLALFGDACAGSFVEIIYSGTKLDSKSAVLDRLNLDRWILGVRSVESVAWLLAGFERTRQFATRGDEPIDEGWRLLTESSTDRSLHWYRAWTDQAPLASADGALSMLLRQHFEVRLQANLLSAFRQEVATNDGPVIFADWLASIQEKPAILSRSLRRLDSISRYAYDAMITQLRSGQARTVKRLNACAEAANAASKFTVDILCFRAAAAHSRRQRHALLLESATNFVRSLWGARTVSSDDSLSPIDFLLWQLHLLRTDE